MVQAPERFEAGRSFVADVVHLGHGAFAQCSENDLSCHISI